MGLQIARLALLATITIVVPASAGETIQVTIDKLKFTQPEISAHVGDTIEWANNDFVAHTATARNKDWDVNIPTKGIGRITLQSTGEFEYYCRFHPNMTGRISVTP